MNYSPCDIGEIMEWDKLAKIVRTTLGEFHYNTVLESGSWQWVAAKHPIEDGWVPICVGLWELHQGRLS